MATNQAASLFPKVAVITLTSMPSGPAISNTAVTAEAEIGVGGARKGRVFSAVNVATIGECVLKTL